MKFKLLSFRASREVSQWEGNSSSLRSVGMTKTLNNAPSLRGSRQADAAIYLSMDYFTDARNDKKAEQGNVFFYILLAVALFAALSYAVSRNNTGSTDIFTDEQAKLAAQEIIEYGNTVANAVQKLRLRGCSDTEISFENDVVGGYINANSPIDNSCHVFHVDGGGINWAQPPRNASIHANTNYNFTGYFCIFSVGKNPSCIGSDCIDNEELSMFLPNVTFEVCLKINEYIGIENPSNSPPQDSLHSFIEGFEFQGIYNALGLGIRGVLDGQLSACYEGDTIPAAGTYHYYQVLIAR